MRGSDDGCGQWIYHRSCLRRLHRRVAYSTFRLAFRLLGWGCGAFSYWRSHDFRFARISPVFVPESKGPGAGHPLAKAD
jgi:hypothetical protein